MLKNLVYLNLCNILLKLLKTQCEKQGPTDFQVNRTLLLFTLFRPMEFSIKLDTYQPVWSIIYTVGFQVIILKNVFISLKIEFIYANSADLDEIPHYGAFHLGLQYLQKYRFRGFQSTKGWVKKIGCTS